MEKIWTILCVVGLLLGVVPCSAAQPEVSAHAAILMNGETGEVLYEKNADQRMLIASTTKIMTALVALEHDSPYKTITVKETHMTEGSSMYLKVGEQVTVEELLYGLLLCSGNDAALALAEASSGSVDAFVAEMNHKARILGMADTSFANPNGLDDEAHYSTARDMARLAVCAAQHPGLMRIASTKQASVGSRTMTNHNRLLRDVEGCIGLKTGYTKAAGRTLVSCAVREGRLLVAVTLNDGADWRDHAALYDYGFAHLAKQEEGNAP